MKIKKIRDSLNILRIKNSEFFSEKYYKQENPEISGDLAKHYYYVGYKEGRNPSEKFDNNYYLKIHKDVKDAGINPLAHYLKIGKKEKRKIRGFNGLSLNKIYYKLYHEMYYANIHLVEKEEKINLFIYEIDNNSIEIIKKIKKNIIINRIIYLKGEEEFLNSISYDIKTEKMYRDYYLDIGINDINICVDKEVLHILNHSCYIEKLYFYTDDISMYDLEFICYLSYYASIDKIKIISSNKSIQIKKTIISDLNVFDKSETVNFIFNHNFILGLEIINNYFLKQHINKKINLFYECPKIHCKISLDNEIELLPKLKDYTDVKKVYFNENSVMLDNKKIINFSSNKYIKIYYDYKF